MYGVREKLLENFRRHTKSKKMKTLENVHPSQIMPSLQIISRHRRGIQYHIAFALGEQKSMEKREVRNVMLMKRERKKVF